MQYNTKIGYHLSRYFYDRKYPLSQKFAKNLKDPFTWTFNDSEHMKKVQKASPAGSN
jgi:hypothetical protein